MSVIKSMRMIPLADDENIGKNNIELCWSKPENFVRIVSVKDESGNPVTFEESEDEIKLFVSEFGPLDLCYEVKQDPIFVELNLICSGKGN